MSAKIIPLQIKKPKTFTSAEALLDEVREQIYKDGRTFTKIATATGVSISTIHNIGSGKTRWPRATTLFPLFQALNLELILKPKSTASASPRPTLK